MKNKEQTNRRILIAPEYAMADLAESHRMASIAKAFLEEGNKVFVLGKGRYDYLFIDDRFTIEEIPFDNEWMNEKKFRQMHNLDKYGLEFIKLEDLNKFVEEEVKLLNKIKPDVVITGFRPTMSISTKISKIPLVWVLSAVVSDLYFEKGLATVPFGQYEQLPFLRLVPKSLGNRLVKLLALKVPYKMKVWNKVAKKNRLKKFSNTFKILRGDFNLMSDASELFPEFGELPPYYDFCGPLIMEMTLEMPESVKNYKKKEGRLLVFFSMGSSGDPEIFKSIIASFMNQPYDVFAATTTILDKKEIPFIPDNVIVEKLFPAFEVTSMSDVVVIHGGQGTVYTTVLAGIPFVGIPMFSEQQYNLENLARKGCGIVLPRPNLNAKMVLQAIEKILENSEYKENVQKVKKQIEKYKVNENYYPSQIAKNKILLFLERKEQSYFNLKGY